MVSSSGRESGDWAPVFAAIEKEIDSIAAAWGYASLDDLVVRLDEGHRDTLNGEGAAVAVAVFDTAFQNEEPSVEAALRKYERVRVNGRWVYADKHANIPLPNRSGDEAGEKPVKRKRAAVKSSRAGSSKRSGAPTTPPEGEPKQEPSPTPPSPPAIPTPPRPTPLLVGSLLNDGAILTGEQDCLNFETTAETVASFLHSEGTATPLVMAINAPWGTGKSSLVNMILRKLERRSDVEKVLGLFGRRPRLQRLFAWLRRRQDGSTLRRLADGAKRARPYDKRCRHTVVRFDAWMHDDAPHIVSAFTSYVFRNANSARSLFSQVFWPASWKLSSKVARFGLLAVMTLAWFALGALYFEGMAAEVIPHNWLTQVTGFLGAPETASAVGGTATGAVLVLIGKALKDLFDSVQKYVNNPERAASQARLAIVNDKLRGLFQQATTRRRRFIIYIDNLERCKPENALALLEVVNQLMSHPQVIVIIAADMDVVAASAGSRFKEQAKLLAHNKGDETGIGLDFGRKYVRKMVQISLTVPRPAKADLTKLGTDAEERANVV